MVGKGSTVRVRQRALLECPARARFLRFMGTVVRACGPREAAHGNDLETSAVRSGLRGAGVWGALPPGRAPVRAGQDPTSWVRCICGGCGRVDGGSRSGLQRRIRSMWRRRDRARFDLVCPWCARGGLVPHSRRSRVDQPISGAARRCPGKGVRPERSEPQSGGLDCVGRCSYDVPTVLVGVGGTPPTILLHTAQSNTRSTALDLAEAAVAEDPHS
jgi:hypothetical protein